MKITPLYSVHVKSGGRMIEFAGYSMPVQYSSILEEHLAVRRSAGLFDVSHMGEFIVSGDNSSSFLAGLIPTSMNKLVPGKGMYTLLCNENGGVIDDLFIFMIENKKYYLVVNASTTEKDFVWLQSHLSGNVNVENISDNVSKIDIQGPGSSLIIKRIFNREKIDALERFSFCYDEYDGSQVMISNSGYTGERGYELFMSNELAAGLWERLILEGSEIGLIPSGLGARDTLRVEACLSLYGNEIDENINPFEANLGWLVNSDAEYVGKEQLAEIKKNGPESEQFCVEVGGKGVPHSGFRVKYKNNNIGEVTSGIYSPTFRKSLAIVRVKAGILSPGEKVSISIRDKDVEGMIVPRPFYRYNG